MEAEEETQTSRLEDIKYYTSLLLGQEQEFSRIFFIISRVRNYRHCVSLCLPLPRPLRVGSRHLHHDAPVCGETRPLQSRLSNILQSLELISLIPIIAPINIDISLREACKRLLGGFALGGMQGIT